MVSKSGKGGGFDDLRGRSSKVSKNECGDVGGVMLVVFGKVPLVLVLVIEVMKVLIVDLVPNAVLDNLVF